jgi:hypothetical protein
MFFDGGPVPIDADPAVCGARLLHRHPGGKSHHGIGHVKANWMKPVCPRDKLSAFWNCLMRMSFKLWAMAQRKNKLVTNTKAERYFWPRLSRPRSEHRMSMETPRLSGTREIHWGLCASKWPLCSGHFTNASVLTSEMHSWTMKALGQSDKFS